jgi:hypothetical protein
MPVARPKVTPVLVPFLTTIKHSSICVEHGRVAQFAILHEVLKLHETTARIFELGADLGVRVHLRHEFARRKFGS